MILGEEYDKLNIMCVVHFLIIELTSPFFQKIYLVKLEIFHVSLQAIENYF